MLRIRVWDKINKKYVKDEDLRDMYIGELEQERFRVEHEIILKAKDDDSIYINDILLDEDTKVKYIVSFDKTYGAILFKGDKYNEYAKYFDTTILNNIGNTNQNKDLVEEYQIKLEKLIDDGYNGIYVEDKYIGYDKEDFTKEELNEKYFITEIFFDADGYKCVRLMK